MNILQYEQKALELKCVDLLSKTYLELDQKTQADTIVTKAKILADDLRRDFKTLTFEDIQEAFRLGVRKTDIFHLNVKTMYTWIYSYRKLLWDAYYDVHTLGKDPKQVPYYKPKNKLLTNKKLLK